MYFLYSFTLLESFLMVLVVVLLVIMFFQKTSNNYDCLTRIGNRRKCRIDIGKKRGKGYGFFVDVDGLKEINDQFGHWAGDQLLATTSLHLKQCINGIGRVYRLGGDEFFMFVRTKNEELVKKILNKIIDTPVLEFEGEKHKISLSIGGSFYYPSIEDFDTFLYITDSVQYNVKKTTKNAWKLIDEETVKKYIDEKKKIKKQ